MNRTVILLFLLLINFQPILGADEKHDEAAGDRKITGKRLAAEGKLSEDAINFISTHFFRPKEIVRADYEKSIPAAIEKAIQNKDENDIAKILAELVAKIEPAAAEDVIKDAKQEIKNETEGKDPGKFDTRYVALMERILWAAMNRNGELAKKEEAKPFNQAFKDPYTKARDFNKVANEKLKQAADGNAEAKKWVNENIRKSTALSLAEGQRKSGNKALSDTMFRGLAFDVKGADGTTQKALDMWGPGKEPQRLYLGTTPASGSEAVDQFLAEKKTFGSNAASGRELSNDGKLKAWYAGKDGKLAKGNPTGFEPKVAAAPPRETAGGGGTGPVPSVEKVKADIRTAITKFDCAKCHGVEVRGNSLGELSIVHPQRLPKSLKDFDDLLNSPENPMPNIKDIAAAKVAFAEFARIQRSAQ